MLLRIRPFSWTTASTCLPRAPMCRGGIMNRPLAQLIPLRACIVGAWALFVPGSVLAAPGGELDATFGENGRVVVELANASLGMSVAQQADGKLLIGGATFTDSGGSDFAVFRLNPDGTPDNSFGSSGTGAVTVDFFQADDQAMSVVVQPDGKILLAGWDFESDYDLALVRLNPDGSLDNTFGGDGRVTLQLGGVDEQVSGMSLLNNGKIVVAGHTDINGDHDIVFARFNANGSLDTSFGTAGTTLVDSGTNYDQAYSMTQQPDGKFIACGLSGPSQYDATDGALLAVRVNQDGSVDTSYGSNGVAIVQTTTVLGQARGCAALQDGSGATILAGIDGTATDANLALARLDANGTLDPSFGTAGQASIDLGGWELAENIVVLDDGTLAVAGVSFGATSDIFLARIDAGTGMLDSTFGNEGVTVFDLGHGSQASATFSYPFHGFGLIEQTDGKLVTLGTRDSFPSAFATARVDPGGMGNAGVAGFVETSAAVIEGTANVRLNLRRTGGSVGEVVVDYTPIAGTAQSPGDFSGATGSVTWADGDVANKTITITISDDNNPEVDESFGVTLSNSPTAGLALAATDTGVTITDNDGSGDVAILGLTVIATGASEHGSISLEVVRSGSSVGAVSVDFATASGTATADTDFTSASGILNWGVGDSSPKTITVNITSDTTVEGDETFTVTLSNPSAGAILGSGSTATITIADDDGARLQFGPISAAVSERGSIGLSVRRTGPASGAVSVDYATTSGSATAGLDYTSASGTLRWGDGDSSSKTVTVDITDDTAVEGDETFTADLSNPSAGALLGSNTSVPITIVDDDPSGGGGGDEIVELLTIAATVTEGASVAVSVARTGPASGTVSVDYATTAGSATAGSDYTSASGTLHWGDGDASVRTITVTTIDDSTDEGDETLEVTLSNASGAALGPNSTASVTISDNDSPAVVPPPVDRDGGGGVFDWLAVLVLTCFGVGSRLRERPT